MTPKFDKLFQSILLEMPDILGNYVPSIVDTPEGNRDSYESAIEFNIKIGEFNALGVYKYVGNNKVETYEFLDENEEILVAVVRIVKTSHGYETDGLWKDKQYSKNLMIPIILNFILPKYPHIQSTNRHSNQARDFWIRLLKYAIPKGYNCVILDTDENTEIKLNTVQQLIDSIGDIWPISNKIPRIYKP